MFYPIILFLNYIIFQNVNQLALDSFVSSQSEVSRLRQRITHSNHRVYHTPGFTRSEILDTVYGREERGRDSMTR
jgi:hypothetical protein